MAKRKLEMEAKSRAKKRKVHESAVNPKNSEGISQCFQKVSTSLYLSLAPIYVSEPYKGICIQHLDPLLMTFFEATGGVVVAHFNLRLHGDYERNGSSSSSRSHIIAKIQYDSPFAFTWVSVDFLVWKPARGDVIEGWISLQSPSHIGLLVHDIFNATIKRDSIPKDWKFIPNEEDEVAVSITPETPETPAAGTGTFRDCDPKSLGYWVDGKGKRIDGKLQFTVKSFNVSGRLVSVQGSLLGRGELKEDLTKMGESVEIEGGEQDQEPDLPVVTVDMPHHVSFELPGEHSGSDSESGSEGEEDE